MGRNEELLDPHRITNDAWYYVEPTKVSIVHEIHIEGRYVRTDTLFIPLRELQRLLDMNKKEKK